MPCILDLNSGFNKLINKTIIVRTSLVASIATGVVLENLSQDELLLLFSQVCGKMVSIDEISSAEVQETVSAKLYQQFPLLPTQSAAKHDWENSLKQAVNEYGENVGVNLGIHSNKPQNQLSV